MIELREVLAGYRGVKVIVLGASGFIGRWVSRYLTLAGADLYLVARNMDKMASIAKSYGFNGTFLQVDLGDAGSTKKVIGFVAPQITFNLVGYGIDPLDQAEKLAWNINDRLVEEIAEALQALDLPDWGGSRLVHVGSAKEYGSIHGLLKEDTQTAPSTIYSKSKLAGTKRLNEFCQKSGFTAIIARLFSVYGPGEHSSRLLSSILMASMTHHHLALTSGEQRRDFTYVEDVAEGLLRLGLLKNRRGEILHLATGKLHTVKEFGLCVAGILNCPNGVLGFGEIPDQLEEWRHGPVSIELLSQYLHWQPSTSIEVGIKKTVGFIKKNAEKKGNK